MQNPRASGTHLSGNRVTNTAIRKTSDLSGHLKLKKRAPPKKIQNNRLTAPPPISQTPIEETNIDNEDELLEELKKIRALKKRTRN